MQDQELRDWLFHLSTKRYFTALHHGAFAGRDFRLQLPGSNTLVLFANLLRVVCDQTEVLPTCTFSWPFLCESFWGGQRFTLSPSRAALTTSITSSPTPCC